MRATPFWIDAEGDAPAESALRTWAPWAVVAIMTTLAAGTFAWLSIARHGAFQSHAFDLGNMDQAAWSTIHGRLLRFTDMSVGNHVLTSRLAIHVEPLLAVISLFYLLHDGPETLLLIQAVVACSGAVPAYLLARRALGRAWLSIVFPLAYLLHPSLQNALLDDFHTVTLSACFLLWAMYCVSRGWAGLYAVAAVLAMSTKEEVGLLVACLGIWWMVRRRAYVGLLSIAAGLGWFLMSVIVIIPAANPGGSSPYLSRYAYLGHGLTGILLSPIRHPSLVLQTLGSEPRLAYLTDILHPTGFVSLMGLPLVLLALPGLAINMLSSDPRMYSGFYQYSVEIIPCVIAGAVFGIAWMAAAAGRGQTARPRLISPVLCALVLLATVFDTHRFGFSPLASGYLVPASGDHQRLENQILSLIPPTAPVAAADEIEPHLDHRNWIYLLPTLHPRNGPRARYVILDASIPSAPVEPHTLRALTASLLRDGYGIVAARDGLLLMRRGSFRKRLPNAFFSFIFSPGSNVAPVSARWGPLHLVGLVVHPKGGVVNRSRPAIAVEAYWTVDVPLPPGVRIRFEMSPTYTGSAPAFSSAWRGQPDSPTWDWLPLQSWPAGRKIRTASLDLVPPAGQRGAVDIAISVTGLGPVRAARGVFRVVGSPLTVRVASIQVDG